MRCFLFLVGIKTKTVSVDSQVKVKVAICNEKSKINTFNTELICHYQSSRKPYGYNNLAICES